MRELTPPSQPVHTPGKPKIVEPTPPTHRSSGASLERQRSRNLADLERSVPSDGSRLSEGLRRKPFFAKFPTLTDKDKDEDHACGRVALWGVPSKAQLKEAVKDDRLSVVVTLQEPEHHESIILMCACVRVVF